MPSEPEIRAAAEAAKAMVEATSVYEDAVQPVAKQIGKALETVGKAINMALAPIGALIWGYEKISDWLVPALETKLATVPPDRIVTPPLTVAGPAIEALRFAGHDDSLRELYANLLATAMDAQTAHTAHPAFVQILQQLSPDEAKLLSYFAVVPAVRLAFIDLSANDVSGGPGTYSGGVQLLRHFSTVGEDAGCVFPELTTSYLDNLSRLGITHVDELASWSGDKGDAVYATLESHPKVREHLTDIEGQAEREPAISRGVIRITDLGRQFIAACVIERLTTHTTNPGPSG